MRIVLLTALVVLTWGAPLQGDSPSGVMVELLLDGRRIEGTPLAWNDRLVHLLGRDGRLWQFAPHRADDFRKTSGRFSSYSTSRLRGILLRELGGDYEVTGTSHYLVAHPRGSRDHWAGRFEDLYRSFVHYFSVRGFDLDEPACPLVGVVCASRDEFARYSALQGVPAGAGLLGFYDRQTNRIVLYDARGASDDSDAWKQNAQVLIHEATHQTAFNTGIHSRYAPPPCWLAEGLATMFEAPGVYDSRYHAGRTDRLNPAWLSMFEKVMAAGLAPERLRELIASDRPFRTQPRSAYAEAWALTFYLVETQRGKYTEYLARTASRPPFRPCTSAERTADFESVFGDDWRMLQARLARFVEDLR